jgi:tRNA(Arg) A34 adenosine deaminase TadA
MCLGAIYWSRIEKIYFACDRTQASKINFDDSFIYSEISRDNDARTIKSEQLLEREGSELFNKWEGKSEKTIY